MSNTQFGLLQGSRRDFLSRRKQQQIKKIPRRRILDIGDARRTIRQAPASGNHRILQPRRLRQFRLRDSDFFKLGLQRTVVQKRDGHGRLRVEICFQQRRNCTRKFFAFPISHPCHMRAGSRIDRVSNIVECSFRIRARASSKRQRQHAKKNQFNDAHVWEELRLRVSSDVPVRLPAHSLTWLSLRRSLYRPSKAARAAGNPLARRRDLPDAIRTISSPLFRSCNPSEQARRKWGK